MGHAEAKPALVHRFADYLKRRPFLSAVSGAEAVTEDVGVADYDPEKRPVSFRAGGGAGYFLTNVP